MYRPQQRRGESDSIGPKRPADDAEQQHRAGEMNREVPDVVPRWIESAECVVDRERQVDDRASGDGQLSGVEVGGGGQVDDSD